MIFVYLYTVQPEVGLFAYTENTIAFRSNRWHLSSHGLEALLANTCAYTSHL
jgi:hypothetical protein